MAQTGFTPIQLYSTSTAAAAPVAGNLTNSTLGSELAINITDGKLFYKDNANAVQVIAWKTTPTTAGGTGLTTYTAGDLSYYATGTTFTKLAIGTAGQILTSTGSAPQWTTLSGVAVTTFSAGTTGFTPNSATSGAVTLAGTLTVGNGGTGTSTAFTTGSVVFAGASGVYSQDNANLFWDDTNNRLGIATAAPATALHVSGTSTTAIARIASTSNGTSTFTGVGAGLELTAAGMNDVSATYGPAIKFGSTDDAFTTTNPKFGAVILAKAAQGYTSDTTGGMDLMFWTSPINPGTGNGLVERARIFASGGVSIGNTTDPGATNLSVTGTVRSGNILLNTNTISTTDTNGNLTIAPNGTGYVAMGGTDPRILLQNSGTYTLQMRMFGTVGVVGSTNNTPLALQTNGTTKLTVNSADSDVKIESGNLVISTSGKGIDFSATAGTGTSELLADYEEGTWTPTVTSGSGTITSYTLNSAVYTKVGRQVTVCVDLTITNAGTGGGLLLITPPFTPTFASSGGGIERNATADAITATSTASDSYIRVAFYNGDTVVVTNRQPVFSLTYFV
jgi:hypothetical protein